MDQDSRSVNAKDFAFLAKDDEKLWASFEFRVDAGQDSALLI